jgi:hypothetical protein
MARWKYGCLQKKTRDDNTSGNARCMTEVTLYGMTLSTLQVGYEPFDIEIKASTGRLQ